MYGHEDLVFAPLLVEGVVGEAVGALYFIRGISGVGRAAAVGGVEAGLRCAVVVGAGDTAALQIVLDPVPEVPVVGVLLPRGLVFDERGAQLRLHATLELWSESSCCDADGQLQEDNHDEETCENIQKLRALLPRAEAPEGRDEDDENPHRDQHRVGLVPRRLLAREAGDHAHVHACCSDYHDAKDHKQSIEDNQQVLDTAHAAPLHFEMFHQSTDTQENF